MLSVNNVSMRYGARVLFEDVTCTFMAGRRYAISGPNGAGKSTLMKILTGEIEPTNGNISRPKRMGVLRQDQFAFDDFRVIDTVIMGNSVLWATLQERDALYAGAAATLMLGAWPEPFGLVAIESMAAGTPVIARRAGALTETIEHGVDGFLVDDLSEAELAARRVADLPRDVIRRRAVERFSPSRMTDEYEAVYARLLAEDAQRHMSARPDARDGYLAEGEPAEPAERPPLEVSPTAR